MITTLRIFLALIALNTGWLIILLPSWWLIILIWDYFLLPLTNFGLIDSPPSFQSGVIPIITSGLILFFGYLVFYLFLPSSFVVSQSLLKGVNFVKVKKEDKIYIEIYEMAMKFGIKMPTIYIYDGGLNAFAVSSFFSNTIAISNQVIQELPTDQARWVVAHEMSHLRNFDSLSNGFWVSSNIIMQFIMNSYKWILCLVFTGTQTTSLGYYATIFILSPFVFLSQLASLILKLAIPCFKLLDKFFIRQIEYRADMEASQMESTETGISLFKNLGTGFEPLFDIFSSHPSNSKRIERLSKVQDNVCFTEV